MSTVKNFVIGLLTLAEWAMVSFLYYAVWEAMSNALEAKLGLGASGALGLALLVPVVALAIFRRRQWHALGTAIRESGKD